MNSHVNKPSLDGVLQTSMEIVVIHSDMTCATGVSMVEQCVLDTDTYTSRIWYYATYSKLVFVTNDSFMESFLGCHGKYDGVLP